MVKLEDFNTTEIRNLVRKYNNRVKIVGMSKLKKADLIKAIRQHPRITVVESEKGVKLKVSGEVSGTDEKKIKIKKDSSNKINKLDNEIKNKIPKIKNMSLKELNELSKKYMNFKELAGLNNFKHKGIVRQIFKREQELKKPKIPSIKITEAEEEKGGGAADPKSSLPPIKKPTSKLRVAPKKPIDVPAKEKQPKKVIKKGGRFISINQPKKKESVEEQVRKALAESDKKIEKEKKKPKPPADDAERIPDIVESIEKARKKGQPIKGLEFQLKQLMRDFDLSGFRLPGQKPKEKEKSDDEIISDIMNGKKPINDLRKTDDINLFEYYKDLYGGMSLDKKKIIRMLQPQEYKELADKFGLKKVFKFLNKFWSKLKSNSSKKTYINNDKSWEDLFKESSNYLMGLNADPAVYRGTITDIGDAPDTFINKYYGIGDKYGIIKLPNKTDKPKEEKPKKKKKKETTIQRIRRERAEGIERDKGKVIPQISKLPKKSQTEFFKYLKEENENGFTLEDQSDLYEYMEDLADKLPKERKARQELNQFDKEQLVLFEALFPKEYIQYIQVENDFTGRKEGIVAAQEKKAASEEARSQKARDKESRAIAKKFEKEKQSEIKQKAKDDKEFKTYMKKNPFKN